jgi:hypothetical protein
MFVLYLTGKMSQMVCNRDVEESWDLKMIQVFLIKLFFKGFTVIFPKFDFLFVCEKKKP